MNPFVLRSRFLSRHPSANGGEVGGRRAQGELIHVSLCFGKIVSFICLCVLAVGEEKQLHFMMSTYLLMFPSLLLFRSSSSLGMIHQLFMCRLYGG